LHKIKIMPFKVVCSLSVFVLLINLPAFSQSDSLLFPLGTALMLTENHAEAEDCFKTLAQDSTEEIALYTNRGINLAMWGLSLLRGDEAQAIIKFVFPFEVAPSLRSKGSANQEEERHRQISLLFDDAILNLEKARRLAPNQPGSYLNLAAIRAIQSRWTKDDGLLIEAFRTIERAELLAPDTSFIQGYRLLIKGIIHDYMDEPARRSECFMEAEEKYGKDVQLQAFIRRNQSIAAGIEPIFASTSEELYDLLEDAPEQIDRISLAQLMNSGSLDVDEEVAALSRAKLYRKHYTASNLYLYFIDANDYVMIHQTADDYDGETSKGIRIGDDKTKLMFQYGRPLRTLPSPNGEYLYYKNAKLIFLLDEDEQVQQWMTWKKKG
jgi:tetratricopeptide (TPR) repeat protein